MTKGICHIIPTILLLLLLCDCGKGRQTNVVEYKISEMEQLKYDNALKKLEDICERSRVAAASGDEAAMSDILDEIHSLKYDFNGDNMGEDYRQKCQALKERIASLKQHPEMLFQDDNQSVAGTSSKLKNLKGTLINRRGLKLPTAKRFPYYMNKGEKLYLKLSSQGSMKANMYNIYRQKCIRKWTVSNLMQDSVTIAESGIYMLELVPVYGEVTANISMSYTGTGKGYHRHVQEKIVKCGKGDFLASESDSIIISSVFKEPKSVGLRGNLKSMFSGKSRALVPVAVPAGCEVLLYSLRISTNERTIPSDGKFAERLSVASLRVKLFGKNVFEKHTIGSGIINLLMGDTRPPREEDAFCNMYVFDNAMQAKRFQDNTASSDKYKYDVDQSQMGTQSCNGQLLHKGHKTIYLGFENERMRYDNYIWLEVAALKRLKTYARPVYIAK